MLVDVALAPSDHPRRALCSPLDPVAGSAMGCGRRSHANCIVRAALRVARAAARSGWQCLTRAVSTHNASAATRDAEFSSTIYNELTLFILQLVGVLDRPLWSRVRLHHNVL